MPIDEKRKYPRLILEIEDGYFGNFSLEAQGNIVAPIVNISAGGINLAVPLKEKDKFKEGAVLLLKSIIGCASLAFLSDTNAEVRWIQELETPGYFSVGCNFRDLSDEVIQQLSRFVNGERMSRGQYKNN
jgi:c-di-GMP-binding flagellar brake protein YcgR